MAKAARDHGDIDLNELFDAFNAQLVLPGGAAQLLGVSRQTIYTLCKRGDLRLFKGPSSDSKRWAGDDGQPEVKWGYIPIQDVALYAKRVKRLNKSGPQSHDFSRGSRAGYRHSDFIHPRKNICS